MKLMQLRLQPLTERHPLADQAQELGHLAGMLLAYVFEDGDLVMHQHERSRHGINASRHHVHIPRQGMTAQDNATVGFCWGHRWSV